MKNLILNPLLEYVVKISINKLIYSIIENLSENTIGHENNMKI